MTHRAEQIIQAVVETLTEPGNNVYRGKNVPSGAGIHEFVNVLQGADLPVDNQNVTFLESILTVYIDIHVTTSTSQVETILNKFRAEITSALWTDYKQGLEFIISLDEGLALEPELNIGGIENSGAMRTSWRFHYRRSVADPNR